MRRIEGVNGEHAHRAILILFVFQNMMTVSDPSIAGKAGDLSERRCTVTRSRSRDIVEAKEEEVVVVLGLAPDPDLRMKMVMSR